MGFTPRSSRARPAPAVRQDRLEGWGGPRRPSDARRPSSSPRRPGKGASERSGSATEHRRTGVGAASSWNWGAASSGIEHCAFGHDKRDRSLGFRQPSATLDYPPRFLAGEIATSLAFALFIGVQIVAMADRLPGFVNCAKPAVLFVGLWAKHSEPTRGQAGQAGACGGLALDALGAPCWFEQLRAWCRLGMARSSPNRGPLDAVAFL